MPSKPRNRRAESRIWFHRSIPTCLKALSFAAERWLPHSERLRLLSQYFHKVVVACLAPGRNSVRGKIGTDE